MKRWLRDLGYAPRFIYDVPEYPANNQRKEPTSTEVQHAKFAIILRHAAGSRARNLRGWMRSWADLLDPRPGVIDFPAEETSAPLQQSGGAA